LEQHLKLPHLCEAN